MSSLTSRRAFLKSIAALSLASLVGGRPRLDAGSAALAGAQDAPNVLILLFDTLSAKHISTYGYHRETMPNLTRFAEQATVYHAHYSTGNYTTPSTASLLTGTYPWSHRALSLYATVDDLYERRNLFNMLADGAHTTLAYTHVQLVQNLLNQFHQDIERLLDLTEFCAVKNTLAEQVFPNDPNVAQQSELSLMSIRTTHHPGSLIASLMRKRQLGRAQQALDAEFADLYPRGVPSLHNNGSYFLEDAIDGIRDTLCGLRQPFVAYFHLWPPHEPYRARREFIGLFDDGWTPPPKEPHVFSHGISDAVLNLARIWYDEFVAYVDAEFGRLLDALAEDGLLDNTYLLLTSDHGELFERGIWAHITPVLYEPVIRVPLLISRPGQDRREDVYTPTSSVDVLPTLLHVTGQQIPDWCEGTVLPAFGGLEPPAGRSVYVMEAKGNPRNAPLTEATFALVKDQYKLIHYRGYEACEDGYELYDLDNDPEEMENLVSSSKSLAGELQAELQAKLDEVDRPYLEHF